MDLAWLTLLALVIVVVLSCTTRVNPGVAAVVLAWLIARWAAPLFGHALDEKALWAGFPAELFLTLLGVSLLFAQAEANGTLTQVANAAERLCRGRPWLVPILFFLLALALGSVGPGNIATAGLVAPVAMAAGRRVGISPLVMAVMVGHGAIASSVSPFTAAGVVANQKLADIGIEQVAWQLYAWNAGANALAAAGGYLLLCGWRSRSEPRPMNDDGLPSAAPLTATPVAPPTATHWTTMAVIGLMIAAVIVAKVHIGMAALIGAAVLAALRAADEREAFRKIPWTVLVMVCGVSVLTSLLDRTGGSEQFARLIGAVSTPGTLTAVLAFVTGIVSIYSSTTGVVLPALLPMVKNIAATQTGSDPLGLALAVLVGGNLVDMSPLSTIGALCLAAAPVECDRRVLFNQLLAWGFAMAVVGAAVSWLCF
jgi:Na+/H+ antiporter NhaD/arsenite permease-like protein